MCIVFIFVKCRNRKFIERKCIAIVFFLWRFLVGGDGNIYEGCGWTREGAHTYGYNKKSVGIGFIGNFQSKCRPINLTKRLSSILAPLSFSPHEVCLYLYVLFLGTEASQKMLDAAHKLITCGKSQGILRSDVRVIGARQVTETASPGRRLYAQIQNWPEWTSNP